MKKYIGVKLIKAEPQTERVLSQNEEAREGYRVIYDNNYESWSPKDVFEKAYYELDRKNKVTITQEDVDGFFKKVESIKQGKKTTVTTVTLINGFEIIEASSCVDPDNFDMEIGEKICIDRIKNKVWELLGFLLQTGIGGFKK